jgi:hypothetical protein
LIVDHSYFQFVPEGSELGCLVRLKHRDHMRRYDRESQGFQSRYEQAEFNGVAPF